ncbi:Outer membrane receptor proteins, mostly Fe transport [Pedobacter westerhofensis]|uniref:Outer membrane receptor proteins, mostly Fe transport n=1 Tax=Pedobacter westerhofensis TaxID=425512 RepID=A0A521AVS9_9SPHI|nr:outer membrane beta-barrel family protein [Pedobacter westerhofensis]SMO38953.1 Outer membrane receptor proteins, mostly Fe transport [Pedobacter westerhofensis]
MRTIFICLILTCFLQYAAAQVTDTVSRRDSLPPARQLGEVIVRGNKPLFQQQAGGLVVNVQSSLLSKGSSVLQVLERSPGVVIDPRNNTIALNGKTGVTVMLDGRLIRLSVAQVVALLSNMNADNIDKIELLSTPPANYDADGNAGLIKIVTRKNKQQGTSGSFNINGGYGKGEKAGVNMSLNHNGRKMNWYGSYAFTHEKTFGEMLAEGTENVLAVGGQTTFSYLGTSKPVSNYHNAIAGFETVLSPSLTIGGNINYTNSLNYSHHLNRGFYRMKPDSVLLFNSVIEGSGSSQVTTGSVNIEKVISKGEKIGLQLDYIYYQNHSNTAVQSSFIDNYGNPAGTTDSLYAPVQRNFADTKINVKVAKLDYAKALGDRWKLESGAKGTFTTNKGVSGIENLVGNHWLNALPASGNLQVRETIAAAYVSLSFQPDSVTSLLAGARYEYSNNRAENQMNHIITFKRSLSKLFPNIFLSRKLDAISELQLSYTRRISRPTYNDLASYITYNDPVSVFSGNPALKPVLTSNLKFGYTYRSYSFSVLASRDEDPIVQGQVVSGPSKQLVYIAPQNLLWQNNLVFQANVPFSVSRWWQMSYSLTAGWRKFKLDYTPAPVQKAYSNYTVSYNQSFTLPRLYALELSGYYNSLAYYGTQEIRGLGSLNIGIKKELRDNKGSFQLSVSDVLSSLSYRSYIGTLTRDAFDSDVRLRYSSETSKFPVFRLVYSRSFGSNGVNQQRRSEGGAKDERQRIGN